MSSSAETIAEVKSQLSKSLQLRLELAKAEAAEKGSLLASKLAVLLVAVGLGMFFFLFLAIAAALYLGHLLHDTKAGFALVSLFFLLLVLLLWALGRKWLIPRMADAIVAAIYQNDHDPSAEGETAASSEVLHPPTTAS